MTVTSHANLDREGAQGKEIDLVFILADNKGKAEQRTLKIIIGDMNDNPAYDGSKRVQVYAYENGYLEERTPVGRVFVEDKDDWDLGDKVFTKTEDSYNMFTVDAIGGMIYMRGTAAQPGNTYTLKAEVKDRSRPNDKPAIGTVAVTVQRLEQAAVDNAGTIRLRGITAAQFLEPPLSGGGASRYDAFRTKLAELLKITDVNLVDVFSVMDHEKRLNGGDLVPVVDVWFAARNSPYKQPTYLNGMVQTHRAEFETAIRANIIMVGIDECYFPQCDECWTRKDVRPTPTLINGNRTALVGATTNTVDVCEKCAIPYVPTNCTANTCMNGAICHTVRPTGFFCECRAGSGNYGARCEGTMRNFNGNGYVWLAPPIKTCTSTNVSVSFMTREPDAMIIYFGPMYAADKDDIYATDFLSITLSNGRPVVKINVGIPGCKNLGASGDNLCTSASQVNTPTSLADGKWHTLDLYFKSRSYTFTVDKCRSLARGSEQTSCRVKGVLTGDDERLNVVDPIQIGGIAPTASQGFQFPSGSDSVKKFDGCIRELYWNNELLDLENAAMAVSSTTRCRQTDEACETNNLDGPNYCLNGGECLASMDGTDRRCVCKPGYMGAKCETRKCLHLSYWHSYTPTIL
jgi:dynein heavy chain 2